MSNTRGISAAFCLLLFAATEVVCPVRTALAQADPVSLLENFPADHRPLMVANADGKAVYADMKAGSLFATNGKPGGTVLLQAAAAAALYSVKAAYMVYEKPPVYIAEDNNASLQSPPYQAGEEAYLWKTDGTPAGTVELRREAMSQYQFISPLGDEMLYAKIGNHSLELWKTDGTPQGTMFVKEMSNSYNLMWQIRSAVVAGGRCYFDLGIISEMIPGTVGSTVWVTDGTEGGTEQLFDWITTFTGKISSSLFLLGDRPLCLCSGVYHSPSMGSYTDMRDGTWLIPLGVSEATTPLPDPIPKLYSQSTFDKLVVANGKAFFLASPMGIARNLYISDGTNEGTVRLADLRPDLSVAFFHSGTPDPVALGNEVLFAAYEASNGWGLWKTDGTGAGTSLVKHMGDPLTDAEFGRNDHLQVSGDLLYFRHAYVDLGLLVHRDLWRSDGTEAGTYPIGELYPTTRYSDAATGEAWASFDLDGVLYFFAKDAAHGMELWRSSGTPDTTVLCEDVAAGPDDTRVSTPVLAGRNVLFTGTNLAEAGVEGIGLWSMPHPFSIVPNLAGLPKDQALAALEKANLASGTVGEQYDAFLPKDAVLSQSIAADARVPRATAVDFVVSLGPEPVVEGEGEPPVEGEPHLEGEPPMEGEVEGEPPAEGETPQEGETVPHLAAVPDLANLDEGGAKAALAAAGFAVGDVTEAYSGTVPAGRVISQDPAAGAQAAPGSAVLLVISMGPEPSGCPGCTKSKDGRFSSLGELLLSGLALSLLAVFRGHL